MKIFISADMEGATGIVHSSMLGPEGKDYERGRRLLTGDVRAAVEGAVLAGAWEVVVCEGHGGMRNILIEELPEKASLLVGPASSKKLCQVEGIDESFDAAFFLAYHAKAGTSPAVHPHTWAGGYVYSIDIDGKPAGETEINTRILARFKVPVVLVTGDDALGKEVKELSEEIRFVEVKKAVGPQAAICLPPSRTSRLITVGAQAALADPEELKSLDFDPNPKLEIQLVSPKLAEKADDFEGVERRGDRTVLVHGGDIVEKARKAWAFIERITCQPPPFLA